MYYLRLDGSNLEVLCDVKVETLGRKTDRKYLIVHKVGYYR